MKKLPIHIDQEIVIRSLDENMPHRATTKVVGARHGDFIIVEEPVVRINDRLIALVEGPINCWFVHEGEMYKFNSVITKKLKDGLTFLKYPIRVEVERLRQHPRIRVNLETKVKTGRIGEFFKGSILDISSGGCFLEINTIVVVAKEALIRLSFSLPNNEIIDDIEGIIRSMKIDRLHMKTQLGIEFIGPETMLRKIESFCQFCEYFKV